MDEMATESSLAEEKAKKSMVDAARLADELRQEQDFAISCERDKKLFEVQCKDTQAKLDESEINALKGGKKAVNKMETRIRELQSELEAEHRRFGDAQKNLRKSERRIKEIAYSSDEDRKNQERMQSLIDQLQCKIKTYKKQIEEAEERGRKFMIFEEIPWETNKLNFWFGKYTKFRWKHHILLQSQ